MVNNIFRAVALWSLCAVPVQADIDLVLPPAVSAGLEAALSPQDVAVLVAAHPEFATTLMFQATLLGLASPSAVVSLLAGEMTSQDLSALVESAAEAAPLEADIIAAAAFDAVGGEAEVIGEAAIRGIEAASSDLGPSELATEAAEVARALIARVPAEQNAIARAIALATSTPDDSSATILAETEAIETADVAPAADPLAPVGSAAALSILPSESQNTPSQN